MSDLFTVELTIKEVDDYFMGLGVPWWALKMGDEFFALPKPGWVTGRAAEEFKKILDQTGFVWTEEVSDCDNFAFWAAAWAQRWHADTVKEKGGPVAGLAFGEIWIADKEHAANVALHWNEEAKRPYAVVYEPQPMRRLRMVCFTPIEMNKADWESSTLVKFG